jgi:hypothetical protein
LEGLRVELLDHCFGNGAVGELDEREATRTAGLAIDRHGNVGRLGDGRKVSAKVGFTCAVREVPDEQTDCQDLLVKTALRLSSGQAYDLVQSSHAAGGVRF